MPLQGPDADRVVQLPNFYRAVPGAAGEPIVVHQAHCRHDVLVARANLLYLLESLPFD